MKVILFGGSGEVGGAVARALIESEACSRLTLLGRRAVSDLQGEDKVEQIVVDTGADDFEQVVQHKAAGHDVKVPFKPGRTDATATAGGHGYTQKGQSGPHCAHMEITCSVRHEFAGEFAFVSFSRVYS